MRYVIPKQYKIQFNVVMFSTWSLFTFTKYGINSGPFIDIWNQVEMEDIWQPA